MKQRRTTGLMVAASLAAAAGLPISALAQEAPAQPVTPAPAAAPGSGAEGQPAAAQPAPAPAAEQPTPETARIRFNFKDAPFDLVLDFFSRESGLPRIDETGMPQGAMTFISPEDYSFEEALTILNLNLLPKGVQLVREKNYLYLRTLKDSARRAGEVYTQVPEGVRPEEIINLTIPLSNARADLVAEQIKTLVNPEYGAVTAVPAQNMLIVVETAAQCKRIQSIVQSIDDVRPVDSETKIFKLNYAKAEAVFNALKGLVGEKRTTVVFDERGNKKVLQEDTIAGLNIQPDPRTNSIVVVGPATRIQVVEELIALLDVPEGANGTPAMMSFALETITPDEARKQLDALFGSVEKPRKPTILPSPEANRLTIVADPALMTQAVALLGEIDPSATAGPRTPRPERRAASIKLEYITPQTVEQLAPRLLTQRQQSIVKFGPAPDGRGLIVTGPDAEVGAFEQLIRGLDVAPDVAKEIRQVRIATGEPKNVLERSLELHAKLGRDKTDPVQATLDAASRTVTLIGGRAAIERFAELLRTAEAGVVLDLETRTFELTRARPSTLGPKLERLAKPLLAPENGGAYTAPEIEPIDELRTLMVRALPEQFGIIDAMVKRLDAEEPGSQQFRVVRLSSTEPKGVIERAQKLYAEQTQGLPADQAGPVSCEFDAASGNVLITASANGMRTFTGILDQVQQLTPPARSTRIVDVQNARAGDLVEPLTAFLKTADPIDPARQVPEPTVRVIDATNALVVTAEDAQHRLISDYVRRLDRLDASLPPLKLLQLRSADAPSIAAMLNEQYSKRPQSERAGKPVEVRSDPATNTLIVSAHEDLFEEIKTFVTELNRERADGEGRQTELFPLKVAKAVDVATAMDKLFLAPPVPVDRYNRPMPWLQKPKEVTVSADPNSNTLMINAPADQMESLRALAEKLDRVELPPQAQLRTYRVTGSNLDAISRTLNGMASRGILSSPAQPGKPQVQVLIETEPRSSTLIVAGDDLTFERVDSILEDLSAVPVEKGLRIVPIANEAAEDVRERAVKIYKAQVAQIPGANPVEVTIDEASNSLMVVADAEAMERFGKIIDELQRQAGPARDVRMIEIRFGKAADVKAFLDDMVKSSQTFRIRGGAEPVFEVIEASNALMVAAQPSHFPIIDALVRNLDNQESTERPPLRILRLHSTDAANLASVLQQSYERRPADKRAKEPVDIQADAATNTLIVSAHPAVLPEIEELVSQLNEQRAFDAEEREIRIFPLKIARAEELAKTIDAMYPEPPIPIDPRTRQPRPDLQRPREVVVRADRATNSLIVDAPGRRLAGFEQIVKSLDQQKLAGNVELRSYRVTRADLNAAASSIRSAASSGALHAAGEGASTNIAITVDVEPTSRTLIVTGPSEIFKAVEDLLKQIDAEPGLPQTGVKMYSLKTARAERIQPVIERVILGRVREQLQGRPQAEIEALVEVAADNGSNTIVISAPENVLVIADALITTLDDQSGGGGGASELRVFRLTKGDAASVAKAISASFEAESKNTGEPAPSVTPEPASNSIVIVGSSRQLERAGKLIEELDATVDAGGMGVRTIRLEHARAESIQPMLETLLRKPSVVSMLPPWEVSRFLAQNGGRMGDEVRIAADRSLNAVIVSAPVAVLDMAEEIVRELDTQAGETRESRPVRIITLSNADATELAANIEAVLGEAQPGREPATVRVDRSSNSLIVRADERQMGEIEQLAAKLDSATLSTSRQMRMIPVDRSRADAALMAQTLKRLMEQQGGVKVEVISVEELLKEPAAPEKRSEAPAQGGGGYWLTTFPALAALALNQPEGAQAAASEPQSGGSQSAEGAAITIAVDPATNSLVVLGSPRATDRLAALAAQLEEQMPKEPSKVRICALPKGADADSLAQIIRQTTQQLGRSGPQNAGGFTGPVSVSADPAGNALIVWANDTDFASITELLRAVTQLEPNAEMTIKVIPLASVTAPRAIEAVNDLLAVRPQGRQAQRYRGQLDLTVESPSGEKAQARLDPALVRLVGDPSGSMVIVAAPAETLPIIERFVSLIDQSPIGDRLAIRRYTLAHARAGDITQTVQQLMDAQRQGPNRNDLPQARIFADARTNSLLVTASEPQHAEVVRLLEAMDAVIDDADLKLEIITLQNATPSAVERIVEAVVIGKNPALRERIQLSAQDGSALFVVRAPEEQLAEIRGLIKQVDTAETAGLPVRFVKLERADAQGLAASLTSFFRDRAAISSRSGQRGQSRVAITGDRRSGTLIVSCNDEDFEQIQALVQTFDAPAKARELSYHIIPLENARVTDLEETIIGIASELQWERAGGFWNPWGGGRGNNNDSPEDKLYVQTNERINSVVVMGQGDTLETMMKIIADLDRPQSEQTRSVVKMVSVERGDLNAMAALIRQVTQTPGWRSWRGPDPDAVTVQVDPSRRVLLLVGKAPRVAQAVEYVEQMKGPAGREGAVMEPIALKHAQAPRAAETLRRIFEERAQAEGLPVDGVSVIGSQDGNLVMITADAESLKIARDLIGLIDQPELGKDRQIEVHIVKNRESDEIAGLIRAQFPRGRGRAESQVIVTPQPSTNAIIVSAPLEDHPQIKALIAQLDAPPSADLSRVVTVPLKAARADEVARALETALPEGLKVKVTPIRRNNTLLVTGSDETIQVVLDQIAEIDVELERPMVELRRIQLRHALAPDVYWTLDAMLRARPRAQGEPAPTVDYSRADNTVMITGTPDQLRDIDSMVAALDVPTQTARKTEFVKLEFARAEQTAKALEVFYGRNATAATTPAARNAAIVPDPASNSLVISADESEWENLRGLLKKLDTEDYDTTRQLAVIPLKHADAASVARALNEGFRAPLESRIRREQAARQNQNRGNRRDQEDEPEQPLVLVDNEPTPTVSAESQTNSLVVFAARQDMERIRSLVEQIDIPDFVKFAEPRILTLSSGKASQIAEAVRQIFTTQRGSGAGAQGPRSVVIVGDDASNSLIIRAEERDYAQIAALAQALEQQGDKARATVRVLPLKNVPAARLQRTISGTFSQAARQQNEVLSVEVDRTSNALVIASSGRLFDEIEKVVKELDGVVPAGPEGQGGVVAPGLGQSVFIIDVQNNSPEDVRRQLESLGITRPQPEDRPGVVSEPVTIVPLVSRRAIAVIASPQDGEAVVSLVRALDAEPVNAEQKMQIVGLKLASAGAIVNTLKGMLNPAEQAAQTGPARAIAEQVRRLSIARNGIDKSDLGVDLSKPIRLIADTDSNSILVGSTEANVAAICDVIRVLDTLPMGEAVVIRIFPLTNTSAARAKTVIDDLFRQGEQLRRVPGTQRAGLPTTATGKALAGELAATVDDRTNTIIVAGPEEAVALVEVLLKDLDSAEAAKWVEPTLIPLMHADASRTAQTLRQVLVQGLNVTPEAVGLQKQIGRLRMVRNGRALSEPGARIEADLFAPLSGLVIAPEPTLNALIIVGSPSNTEVVRELIGLLDVEAASAANTVRLYPLQYAAADRVSSIVTDIFRQRQQDPASRPEDRVIITADARTNTLIVSTSAGSFSILEAMLKTLDSEQSNNTVALHVLPVTGADAAALAPRINRLMTERIQATQRAGAVQNPTDVFSVEADAANNVLIVAASEENLAIVKELVTSLTQNSAAVAGSSRTDVVQVKAGRASDVATAVRELYVDRENARRGRDSVNVVANERLNALVVTGTEDDVRRIAQIVDSLASAGSPVEQDIRRIGLRSANALEVVSLLQNVLAGRPVSGGNDIAARQATNIRFFRDKLAEDVKDRIGAPPTEAQVDGAIREQVTLTPDLRTNSVMVKAPPKVMQVIADIIDDLDTTSAGARRIAKFTLVNADVDAMARLLRDVFTLRQQGNNYVLVPTQMEPVPGADPLAPETQSVTPVPDERQELAIAIDRRTNTLIVSGTEEYLERVREIVEDLDNIEAEERAREVYAVRHALAKDLERTLTAYFQGESQTEARLLGPDQVGSVMRQLEQEVTVVGDELSNKLVISASPRYMDMVLRMVRELDTAPPQVVIQVLLAEVTLDANASWGADLKLRNIGGQNMSITSLAAGAGVATALGVPNLTFAATDFDLILRALEAQGRLQVLSRPSVTARNNTPASIQVGENVAVVAGNVERTPQGGTISGIDRKDIGIILDVLPSISPDGFVQMKISPSISQLSSRNTQITQDFVAPILTQRKVDTTVTVKDGQTVVIGGLIETRQEDRRSKTPILGDVPLAGWLFRSKSQVDVKTELLVILTPRIIYSDAPEGVDEFRRISEHKINQIHNPLPIHDAIREDLPPGPAAPLALPPELVAPEVVPPPAPVQQGETYVPPRGPKPVAPAVKPIPGRWRW